MADNRERITVTNVWQSMNVGGSPVLPIGTNLKVQHVGGDDVRVAVSAASPTTDVGERIDTYDFVAVGDGETSAVWVKIEGEQGSALISVQDNT